MGAAAGVRVGAYLGQEGAEKVLEQLLRHWDVGAFDESAELDQLELQATWAVPPLLPARMWQRNKGESSCATRFRGQTAEILNVLAHLAAD